MANLLRSSGVSDAEIADAASHGHLNLLCVEKLALPDPHDLDLTEVADITGLPPELVRQLRRSLGFVEPEQADRLYGDIDIEVLESIGELLETGLVDVELVVQMARVIGSSTARIASAIVDVLDPIAPDEADDAEGTEPSSGASTPDPTGDAVRPVPGLAEGDQFALVAPHLFPMLLRVIDYVWSRHLQVEARARMSRDHAGSGPEERVVGFADLVGFTALSQQVGSRELAEVVDRFEAIAYDVVERHDGRVVKMIGDEVMFTVADVHAGAAIALELSETFRDDHHLADVRVGLAAGPVLQREADLFGPVVNRASRIVSLAFPGTILCDDAVHEVLADDVHYRWRSLGRRTLRNIGKVPVHVLRRPSEPTDDR